jgi:proteasome lid subunit RPN8/RPN11
MPYLQRPKPRKKKRRSRKQPLSPVLKLTPYAMAKLRFLRDLGPTEIGGFALTSDTHALVVQDVGLVQQECDWASVLFNDEAVADYFDQQVDLGRSPERFARVWVHTHPDCSAQPSAIDEETFGRVFGECGWAVMLILARNDNVYARLRVRVGPGTGVSVDAEMRVEVDDQHPFPASNRQAWQLEYDTCVTQVEQQPPVLSADDPWEMFDCHRWTLAGDQAALEDIAMEEETALEPTAWEASHA